MRSLHANGARAFAEPGRAGRRWQRSSRLTAMVGSAIALSGCHAPATASGCRSDFLEPLIRVASVTDAATGLPLADVRITDVAIDGVSYRHMLNLLVWPDPQHRVTMDGSELVCAVVCAFGNEEGEWRLSLARPGYQTTKISLRADYPVSNDCGLHSGSVPVFVELIRAT